MAFEDRIRDFTNLLRTQASEDEARVSRFREIESQEQAARFGLGGVSASRVQGVQQESADRLVSALRQADMFGAEQLAGEEARVGAFNREAELKKELQKRELANRLQVAQLQIDAQRESQPSALETVFGAAANIGGSLLMQKAGAGMFASALSQSRQQAQNFASRGNLPTGAAFTYQPAVPSYLQGLGFGNTSPLFVNRSTPI